MSFSSSDLKNNLSSSSSLYLKQHAANPVAWQPWGDQPFEWARELDRPVIVSIGYSSCHWCHVMEHESFESEEVARVMNDNFICIKVDREEHPDVDHFYMEALQAMTGQGGWPLNCIVLPDKRPVFGGTYFSRKDWISLLESVVTIFHSERNKFEDYATRLIAAISPQAPDSDMHHGNFSDRIDEGLKNWIPLFDKKHGGTVRVPKFPLPASLNFLLEYGVFSGKKEITDHAVFTLKSICSGGLFDQLAGGFARYSTDKFWKVPHFEKMLYDNGQLLSALANAYKVTANEQLKYAAELTVNWLASEMCSPEGAFYSSVDADSEGEEGSFYVWTFNQLLDLTGKEFMELERWLVMDEHAGWEGDKIILMEKSDPDKEMRAKWRPILKLERDKRERPVTDTKIITAWNGLAISGLCEVWLATGNQKALELALHAGEFFLNNRISTEGSVMRIANDNTPSISGRLDDYVFLADAFLKLNVVTGDAKWIEYSESIVKAMFDRFYDEELKTFRLDEGEFKLPVKLVDNFDNVIPSAASHAFRVLLRMGHYNNNNHYIKIAGDAASRMAEPVGRHLESFTNWASLMMETELHLPHILVEGDPSDTRQLGSKLLPFTWIYAHRANKESRFNVCKGNQCYPAVFTADEALQLLRK